MIAAIAAAPIPIASGEFSNPPLAAGQAPGARFLFFLLLFLSVSWEDASRGISWPWATMTTSLPSLIVRSPFRPVIHTIPSTSETLNSVHAKEAGVTFTSPAVVATPLDVETVTPPCTILVS